jgi:VCBS repeat protein
VKRMSLLLLLLAATACSTSAPSKPTAPPPQAPPPDAPSGPIRLSRLDPDIVEETETYYIKRLPKEQYLKVDDRHVKHPLITQPVAFFKEDDKYYYISVSKTLPEEAEAKRLQQEQSKTSRPTDSTPPPSSAVSAVPLADFEDLNPPRQAARLRLEPAAQTGLPEGGMWRASFRIADVNGDRIPDIVSPPARLGDGDLKIWIGDGTGRFTPWKLSLSEAGKPLTRFSIDYGGVAVGDIDADGQADVVSASHSGGLVSLFGDGQGGFAVVRAGLPGRDFSAQAVTLVDADADGKLDLVASRDVVDADPNQAVDKMQVRVYGFLGREKGWEHRKEGIIGGFYSNSLNTWDYDGDGHQDVLTGSHYTGALTLLWRNQGGGMFSPVMFPAIEVYSYHFATAPGAFGKGRAPAFADSILMQTNVPENARAAGITLYSFQNGEWTRHRLWRKKDPKSSVYGLAMGDLDGDGLDEVVFADSERRRVRILTQRPDGTFAEVDEADEPELDSPGQCIRLADVNGDGRLDVVVSKTVTTANPNEKGGWGVYLNRVK